MLALNLSFADVNPRQSWLCLSLCNWLFVIVLVSTNLNKPGETGSSEKYLNCENCEPIKIVNLVKKKRLFFTIP